MKIEQFTTAGNMNEIVFENRNKQYGAYALRKTYNDRVLVGLFISSVFFLAVFLLSAMFTKKGLTEIFIPPTLSDPIIFSLNPSEIVKAPEIKKGKSLPKPKPIIENAIPIVVEEEKDKEEVKPTEPEPYRSDDGNTGENSPGENSGTDPGAIGGDEGGEQVENKATEMKNYGEVDVKPEFPGGYDKYLAKNLRYPRLAVEGGIKGTVYLSFIIDAEGNVKDVKVVKGIGGGCDDEALRVIRNMPKWRPGMVKERPVVVFVNLPVKFQLK